MFLPVLLPMIFRKVHPGKVLINLEVTNLDFQPISGHNDPIFDPLVLRLSGVATGGLLTTKRCS